MEKETQEKITQLQTIEQSMQAFLMQKQQLQTQLLETESALKELEKTNKAYKIVGNIMVASDKETIKKELEEKKKTIDIRLKSLEKQEKTIKDKATIIQKEVMEKLKEK